MVLNITGSRSVHKPWRPFGFDWALELSQAQLCLRSRDGGHINISAVNEDFDIWTSTEEGLVERNHAVSASFVQQEMRRSTLTPNTSIRRAMGMESSLDISAVQVRNSEVA